MRSREYSDIMAKKKAYRSLGILTALFAVLVFIGLAGDVYAAGCSYRIMTLGDSITQGVGSTDVAGYRKYLYNLLVVQGGYNVDFVGSLEDGPANFDNRHEGHPGWSAAQIAEETYWWLKNNPADIVLLHAGTNGVQESTADIEKILNEIDRFSPDTWVVLALIINRNPYSGTTTTFNDNLLQLANQRIANGDKIVVVDQENALDYPGDLIDDVHPNDAGYQKMAQAWASASSMLLDDLCTGKPDIIGSVFAPATKAYRTKPYQYDVNAYGAPSLFFQLTTAPAGMTINASTGLISWTPTQAGAFNVTVRASNSLGSDTQSWVLTVSEPALEVILDNGAAGTTAAGNWPVSLAPNPYGANSLYSRTPGDVYTYDVELSGMQDVYLWWTAYSNRSASVPVEIYDGTTLLDTVYVDQTRSGGQWSLLGRYSFSRLARVQIFSVTGLKTTCADAVRFSYAGETTPVISSSAGTSAEVGTAYFYDVEASGTPVLFYELTAAPAGMTINASTGLISWTPAQTGTFNVTVRVSNGIGSDLQSWVVTVSEPALEVILDNGGVGTTAAGSWPVSLASQPYGTNSIYSKTIGATYTYQASVSGPQDVYMWWTVYSNRSTSVPVEIYDGATLLGTVNVDQTRNGGQWNLLGSYTFSGPARVVIVSTSSSKTTCADAVRFLTAANTGAAPDILSVPSAAAEVGTAYFYDVEALGTPVLFYELTAAPAGMMINASTGLISWMPAQTGTFNVTVRVSNGIGSDMQSWVLTVSEAALEVILDNGGVGTTAAGSWLVSLASQPYGTNSVYSKSIGATYTYQASVSGPQDVYMWWTVYSNRSTSVPVEIYDGATLLGTVNVDQTRNGGQWNLLGSYTFSGPARVVIVSTSSTKTTCADAVRFLGN